MPRACWAFCPGHREGHHHYVDRRRRDEKEAVEALVELVKDNFGE